MSPLLSLFVGSLVLVAAAGAYLCLAFSAAECLHAVRSLFLPEERDSDPAAWPRPFRRLRAPDPYSTGTLRGRLEAVCRRAEALRSLSGGGGGAPPLPALPEALPEAAPEGAFRGRLYPFRASLRPPEAPGAALPLPDARRLLRPPEEGGPDRAGDPLPALRGWRL